MWTIAAAFAGPIPAETRQLVLVVPSDPNTSRAELSRWDRSGGEWRLVEPPIPVRIGASGVAWGRGLHPPQPGVQKVEGDDRAPAGVFLLGDAYGDPPSLEVRWPYHPVTPRDLWFEDPASPLYNTHLQVPGDRPLTPEEAEAVMRRGDPAHALKVFVHHNTGPAEPGAGSAIFLHVWRRDGAAATAGCTAMARPELDELVAWLDPASAPVMALLSAADLARLAGEWGLPLPPVRASGDP